MKKNKPKSKAQAKKPKAAKAVPAKKSSVPKSAAKAKPKTSAKTVKTPKRAVKAKAKTQARKTAAPKKTSSAAPKKALGLKALNEARIQLSWIENGNAKTLRPKTFDQWPAQKEFGFPAEAPQLPDAYGRDRLVLMSKDPDFLFSYWEVTPDLLGAKAGEKHPGEEYREVLKLNWPARSLFDVNFALLPIAFETRRWYLRAPFHGLPYNVELGWLGDQGHFISILGSNDAETAESWEATVQRLQGAAEPLAYSARIVQPLGASEHMQIEESRFAITDWNMSSGSFSSGSAARTAEKTAVEAAPAPRGNGSLRVEAQLKPGSRLRVDGREISADSKGKVSADVAAPAGALTVELDVPGGGHHAYTYDL